MLRNRVIPTLLLKNNGLVKTTKFKDPVYVGDPINAVKIFNDKEVDELILLDITATNENKEINFKKIEEIISEAFMPIGYGGGIKTIKQIEKLFKMGLEKVIINSAAYSNPNLIKEAVTIFGSQSIVLSVDIRKDFLGNYKLYSNSGTVKQNIKVEDHLKRVEDLGAGEIYLNNIDKDGTLTGYDFEFINIFSTLVSVPVIVAGGAASLEDFTKATEAGADAVSAGAMFVFQGVHRAVLISYPNYKELEKKLN